MSEIPEDIHQAAESAFEDVLNKAYKEYGFSSQYRLVGLTAREIIARAILAERERCAVIAEDRAPVFQDMEYAPVQEACADIARAIRNPKP